MGKTMVKKPLILRKLFWLLLFIVLLFCACQQNDVPADIFDRYQMANADMLGNLTEQSGGTLIPQLPQTGHTVGDFMPEGWILLESAVMDYNGDGNNDMLAVLEYAKEDEWHPRLLIALQGNEEKGYTLDFQNANIIRTADEKGFYIGNAEPYYKLEIEGNTFTVRHQIGGSMKQEESYTFQYTDEGWYLLRREINAWRIGQLAEYVFDDYGRGVGRRMSSNRGRELDAGGTDFEMGEVVYQVALEEAPELSHFYLQAERAGKRLEEQTVKSITLGENIPLDLPEVPVGLILKAGYLRFINSRYMVYTYPIKEDIHMEYLVVFNREEEELAVIANAAYISGSEGFGQVAVYRDKIYALQYINEPSGGDYKVLLQGMDCDGKNQTILFEQKSQEPIEASFEITGGEIILKIIENGDATATESFRKLNLDGGEIEAIGQYTYSPT